ncbi:hypothetical protein WSM22_18280 [Cytophagales bacterium WSM2-2]|nr:hypothetical protein WSM22_18280 [Cytophagales bacterium WSM2-2]
METAGAICFGLVIGWITYRTLRRKDGAILSDIAGVIGAIGGAGITGLFAKEVFSAYCIGLAIGFFMYLIISFIIAGKEGTGSFMD